MVSMTEKNQYNGTLPQIFLFLFYVTVISAEIQMPFKTAFGWIIQEKLSCSWKLALQAVSPSFTLSKYCWSKQPEIVWLNRSSTFCLLSARGSFYTNHLPCILYFSLYCSTASAVLFGPSQGVLSSSCLCLFLVMSLLWALI